MSWRVMALTVKTKAVPRLAVGHQEPDHRERDREPKRRAATARVHGLVRQASQGNSAIISASRTAAATSAVAGEASRERGVGPGAATGAAWLMTGTVRPERSENVTARRSALMLIRWKDR